MTLFEAVCDTYNLHQAWMDVWGKRTVASRHQGAGVDGVTIADWEADWAARLQALQADLRGGTYRSSPLLWFDVPRRPARGRGEAEEENSARRLGIPTVTDRVAQRAVKNTLEPIFERVFLSCSHGFRPERSVFTAIAHVLWHEAQGRRWVADADIEAYFDSVQHARLLRQLAGLGDERIVDLIAGWLPSPSLGGATEAGRGLAQGAVISPLLANVYLHPFDVAMVEAGRALVRYADDFVVMCTDAQQAELALTHVTEVLAELGLSLNRDKTAVVPFGPDFHFLGAQFSTGGDT